MKKLVFVGLTMAMVFSVRAISLGLSVSGITRPNSDARASFQRNAGLFAIAREGCLSGLQRGS